MGKQLVFTVVDHSPNNPYEAYWDGTQWEIRDGDDMFWHIGGNKGDAQDIATVEHQQPQSDQLIQALSVALHPQAATAYIKGGSNE